MGQLAAAVAVAACLLSACSRPAALPSNTEQIGEGLYLFNAGDQRSLFMVTDEGVVVTDPINAEVALSYRAAISEITDQPVKFVVYSHYHWDRASGAEVFTGEGAQVVTQERCQERFEDNPNAAVVSADITFSDHYELKLGGRSLELFYLGPSHGDCLTVFLARPANMLQIVELVNPPRAAFPRDPNVTYVRPHNLRQFCAALEQLADENGVETVIASRISSVGDPEAAAMTSPPTAPVSIIGDQADFWHAIYDIVENARRNGRIGIDGSVQLSDEDLRRFERFDGYEPDNLPIIMRRFVGYYDMGR